MMKILMVTMGLDIGGAETHIVELSRELCRRGCEVIIASAGGVYVREVEGFGARHVRLPLNTKSPGAVRQSYRGLKQLILREKPDIVHAHARIPAFITGLIHRRIPFHFVTTAHWVFHVTPLNRFLTNWGTYTVAVSDDIREYLIDEYDLRPDQISVTINGIDMEKFSPERSGARIREEFALNPDAPVITYVSRMDESRALAAAQLIGIAPELDRRFPGIQLLIVGGGDQFETLSKKSEELNQSIGRRCIIMTGARTDINELVAAGDIFVGVSRAALEAMSAGKPAVIAGNEGYIGIFAEEKLEISRLTNFCCRGCDASDEKKLLRDVTALLEMTPEQRNAAGAYGRSVIRQYYSAEKMTDDYMAVYQKAVCPRCSVLLSGYYGFRNAGDEAILSAVYENLMNMGRNIAVDVLIADPDKNRGRYPFRMVDRFRIGRILRAIRESDVLISGGGSLLQDSTSTKSLLYYVTVMNLAKRCGKKLVMYANGIGPVTRPGNRKRVKKIVEKADLITLRDARSAEELTSMGVRGKEFHITADPVFAYKGADVYRDPEQASHLLQKEGLPPYRSFVGISVRDWERLDPEFVPKLARICDEIHAETGLEIVFIAMQASSDRQLSEAIRQSMESPSYLVEYDHGIDRILGITGSARFILCMRLHTLIFAAHMGVPALGLVYDPKVEEYLSMLRLPAAGSVESLDTDQVREAVRTMTERLDDVAEMLQDRTGSLRAGAEKNTQLLDDFLEKLQRNK